MTLPAMEELASRTGADPGDWSVCHTAKLQSVVSHSKLNKPASPSIESIYIRRDW